MKPTREMVKERLEALEGQATKVAVLEAWDGMERIESVLMEKAVGYFPEAFMLLELTRAKVYRALGGDA